MGRPLYGGKKLALEERRPLFQTPFKIEAAAFLKISPSKEATAFLEISTSKEAAAFLKISTSKEAASLISHMPKQDI